MFVTSLPDDPASGVHTRMGEQEHSMPSACLGQHEHPVEFHFHVVHLAHFDPAAREHP